MKKILFLILISFLFLPNTFAENTLDKNAKSGIIIEASTGTVLYEHDVHKRLAPASMTKMMSLLLVMEAIDSNVIKLDDMITVSKNASDMGGSQILLEEGEQMSVDDLIKGVSVASGNDAIVALAEAIAGTEENFVKMMNDKVKELGLKNTNFKNCHGLDAKDHYSSAYDMAFIAKELVSHQLILDYSSIYETYLREKTDKKIWLVNTNKLVRFKQGVDGLKTGYTKESGYCLTATMKKDNMRIISVVMGEPDSGTRNSETSSMLDYAYAQYTIDTLYKKDDIVAKKKVLNSKEEVVNIIPIEDINILRKKIDKDNKYTIDYKYNEITYKSKKGDVVGKLLIKKDNEVLKEYNLTVDRDLNKLKFYELYLRNIKDIIIGKINIKH